MKEQIMNANTVKVKINPSNVIGSVIGNIIWHAAAPYSLVSAILIGAKIAGKIDAPWWMVTSMVWGPFATLAALGIVAGVIFGMVLAVLATVDTFKMHAYRKENARKLAVRQRQQQERRAAEEARRAQMRTAYEERVANGQRV